MRYYTVINKLKNKINVLSGNYISEGSVSHINGNVGGSQPSCLESGVKCDNSHSKQRTLSPAFIDSV